MSKIIKADFVVERRQERLKKTEHEARILAVGEQESMYLTKETADSLYLETKIMLEELVTQAQRRADAIILKAKEEAQAIVETSQGDVSRNKVESWDNGYEQGYKAGHQEAQDELKRRYREIASLLQKLENDRQNLFGRQREEIMELIMTLTEKILGSIVELRPEVISQVIRNTLEQVKGAQKITVKINPVHIPYLSSSDEIFKEAGLEYVDIIEDPAIKQGDCQIVTENGFVDAVVEEQLQELKRVLMEATDDD
ncbi:MAG: FliH/SctL family protein [Clostridia bacterium]|nr:FliH/SctL family protein [Clostridia bacterium]